MILYNELAEYYFSIESNHRIIANDIHFIRSFSPQLKKIELLDIGCGTGEHLNLLSREGFFCTGLDASPEMIEFAQKRNPNIPFVISDMTRFDYYEKFDMIVSLFGSIDYCIEDKDIESVLWNTRRALRNDGIAIFEIWHSVPVLKIRKKEMSPVSTTFVNGTKIIRERGFSVTEESTRTTVRVDYRYEIYSGEKKEILTDFHIMRAYQTDEFEKFTTNNGFNIIGKYSNTLKEPVKENSNRLVYVLQKK